MRKLLYAVLSAATVAMGGSNSEKPAAQPNARTLFETHPSIDYSSTSIDGQKIDPKDHQGELVIIVCGGTWCHACQKGLPVYESIQKKYNVPVIDFEFDSPHDAILENSKKFGVVQVDAGDYAGEFAKRFEPSGIGSFPRVYMKDRQGVFYRVEKDLESFIQEKIK